MNLNSHKYLWSIDCNFFFCINNRNRYIKKYINSIKTKKENIDTIFCKEYPYE